MEVMEEGNLMDRVPILLQRDLQYYQENQTVLQETICPGVVGGKLDFPRHASFASVKIVLWWEDEYYAAYKKNSGLLNFSIIDEDGQEKVIDGNSTTGPTIVKSSDPEKFVGLITKSADSLLEHVHTLSQEALDHADLTVLTATIGASALIKNSLWVYLQCVTTTICPPKGDDNGGSLKISYRQYSEMTEALAERLLDLHCRLLTLYIMQDADCLHWENFFPFFESERGSYTIQMWWLYMQGTKDDLWNSVPPNMAQRVFSGMLNETLTILTVRYTQTIPSKARSQLLLVDICNILMCVAELLPLISDNGEAYVGLNIINQSKIIRDIHSKCQELFCCLLLRGVPLGVLYKVLRKENSSAGIFTSRQNLPTPWIVFALPKLFPPNQNCHWATRCSDFGVNTAIALEIKVILGAPQSNWTLLLKVLLMREATLSSIILHHLMKNLPSSDSYVTSLKQPLMDRGNFPTKCDGFLCGNECKEIKCWTSELLDPIGQTNYQVVLALCYIIMMTGKSADINQVFISCLEKNLSRDWASCLDRRQVWNQKRPPWLEAIVHLIYPFLDPIVHMLIAAVQGGASMYQAMALSISSFSEMWDCIPDCLYTVTVALAEIIPAHIKPLGDEVLIQILFCALYTKLLETSEKQSELENGNIESKEIITKSSICQTLAEAICFIDEDNKHTDQLKQFLNQTKDSQRHTTIFENEIDDVVGISLVSTAKIGDLEAENQQTLSNRSAQEYDVETAEYIAEVLASDVLTTQVGKQCVKIIYKYLRSNEEWILQQLGVSDVESSEFEPLPGQKIIEESPTLLKLMFHIGHHTFDQILTGGLKIDYNSWLQTPMSLNMERAWLQVSQRYEFQEHTQLTIHEAYMVASITSNLKP